MAIRAILKGDQKFVPIACSSKTKSDQLILIAHQQLQKNKKLRAIFPIIHAFAALNGNSHLCTYQTFKGEKTDISIKGDIIRWPKLDGTHISEAAILTAIPYKNARGLNIEGYRPGAIVLDDVQKTEDATSPTGPGKNKQILTSDIAYLGTRQKPVSIINNATIICANDFPSLLADMPAFTTVRYKMVDAFPDGVDPAKNVWPKHWSKYFELKEAYDRDVVGDLARANRRAGLYYWWHRKEMDAGSKVTWDHAYSFEKNAEISTIQAAINFIHAFGWESFCSECQNQPMDRENDKDFLTADKITEKQHGYGRGKVPPEVIKLEAGIDVQQEMFFVEIWGYSDEFSGFKVFDFEFPDQKVAFFEKKRAQNTLSKHPDYKQYSTLEARIKAGVLALWAMLAELEFKREGDDSILTISKMGTDTGLSLIHI